MEAHPQGLIEQRLVKLIDALVGNIPQQKQFTSRLRKIESNSANAANDLERTAPFLHMDSYPPEFPATTCSPSLAMPKTHGRHASPERAPWRMRLLLKSPAFNPLLRSSIPSVDPPVASMAPAQPTPPPLLPLVADGDHRAMKACIDTHGPLVWAIVSRRVRDRSDAEDLTQEIFTEIWKKAATFDPAISSETTFIGMIARRRAIDFHRKALRLPEIDPLPPAADIPAPSANPGQAIDRELLWAALQKLPEETRQLFTLHFDEGLTHSEITERTGLPLGTVKTRLRRGLIEARSLVQHFAAQPATSPLA